MSDADHVVLLEQANAGDVQAMLLLGEEYYVGIVNGQQEFGEALVWFEKAAELGDSYALTLLASMYERGEGTPVNLARALDYYEQAQALGEPHCEEPIARIVAAIATDPIFHRLPEPVPSPTPATALPAKPAPPGRTDLTRPITAGADLASTSFAATKLMKRVQNATAGDVEAMYELGFNYYDGSGGVKQNLGDALVWFGNAAAKGHSGALFMLGAMYENGSGIPVNLPRALNYYKQAKKHLNGYDLNYCTPAIARVEAAIAANPALRTANAAAASAADYSAASASTPQPPHAPAAAPTRAAPTPFARISGTTPAVSSVEAKMSAFMEKANAGDVEAMYQLGYCYYVGGGGGSVDYGEALVWYSKAAAMGHSTALASLGWMHENGDGTPVNLLIALEYYKQAKDKGYDLVDVTSDIARIEAAIAADPALRTVSAAASTPPPPPPPPPPPVPTVPPPRAASASTAPSAPSAATAPPTRVASASVASTAETQQRATESAYKEQENALAQELAAKVRKPLPSRGRQQGRVDARRCRAPCKQRDPRYALC